MNMRWPAMLRLRLRSLFRRGSVERELDKEICFHIEELTQENIAAGMSREEARAAAMRSIGTVAKIQEECRDTRRIAGVEMLIGDVRYAFRAFRKNPGFTAIVVVSLTMGIGANTAIFTLMNAVIWRSLPVEDPEALLVVARSRASTVESGFTYPQYMAMRRNGVAELAGYSSSAYPLRLTVNVNGEADTAVDGQLVTGNYFSLLGVHPFAGRSITPEDDLNPAGEAVVMISYGYWERSFGGEHSAIGRTVTIFGVPFTIIGVTPPRFFGIEAGVAPDVFIPMKMQPAIMPVVGTLLTAGTVNRPWVQTLARLRPGVQATQAAAQLDPLYRQEILPVVLNTAQYREQKLVLIPAATALSELRRQFSPSLYVLMSVVGVVLLIACANTGNLLLSRALSRRREIAMRMAIGGSRSRVMQQLFVESLLLSLFAGACGVVLAYWSTRVLVAYMSSANPIRLDLHPNLRMLVFTLAVSLLAAFACGLAPAWHATRIDLTPALKNLGRGRSTLAAGKALVIAQVALSLVLLFGAGLFIRTLRNLNAQDDLPRDRVLVVRIEPAGSNQRTPPNVARRLDQSYRALLESVRRTPGVASASMVNVSPTKPNSGSEGPLRFASGESVNVSFQVAYTRLFDTLGLAIVKGRDFTSLDLEENAARVCIVNESFVRQALKTEDPIGKPCMTVGQPPRSYEIIGVVQDSHFRNLRSEPQAVIYQPFLQANTGRGQMILYVRTTGIARTVAEQVRLEVERVDANVPQYEVQTLSQELDATLVREHVIARLSGLFAAVALLLASVGLYGLLAFSIAQRTAEVGIRMAIGARRTDVVRLILREALALVGVGLVIGVPVTLVIARLFSNRLSVLLFGIQATDTPTLVPAAGLLMIVAMIAAALPARLASGINPIVALRHE